MLPVRVCPLEAKQGFFAPNLNLKCLNDDENTVMIFFKQRLKARCYSAFHIYTLIHIYIFFLMHMIVVENSVFILGLSFRVLVIWACSHFTSAKSIAQRG